MRTLEELKSLKQSLERQIESSRNARLDLIEDYDEIEVQIKYQQENAEFTDEEMENIPFLDTMSLYPSCMIKKEV